MGSLLSLLNLHRNATLKTDIFVDFENARPTESEKEVYILAESVLFDAADILADLQTYKGASAEIRQAIGNPHNKDLQLKAWNTVVPLVCRLKKQVVISLLGELCSDSMTPLAHLDTQQALVKQFASILDFVLKFDELKMLNPSIQNDFSYYRRTISRLRSPNPNSVTTVNEMLEISDINAEMANKMSLFYANATPMLRVLSEATLNFVTSNQHLPMENTTETLGTMLKVCQRMIENQDFCSRFQNEGTVLFVLRVMVAVIILYDHVHPIGAFAKTTQIDVRGSIKVLKEQPPTMVEGLLNALRYTTRHLNDDTTPKNIKSLLAA
ncbi:Protein fam49b [Blomia tropicalis]|nr:Protein fam49b [Blomia tropicalis]